MSEEQKDKNPEQEQDPAAVPEEASEEASTSEPKAPLNPLEQAKKDMAGIGKKVIVVDDDPTTLQLINKNLSDIGFDVITAQNGKEARTKITPEFPPNIIITDVLMPEMDGFEFFKELRGDDDTKEIPILILTGRKNMEDSFMAMGADAFFSKPLDMKDMIEQVLLLSNRTVKKDGASQEKKDTPSEES